MAGFGAPRRGPRLPPSVLLVLLAVLGLLAFNYWSVSGRQAELASELGAMQAQAERTEVARLRLERRNSELLLLIDEHRAEARREREQRGGLEQRLWGSQGRQIGMQENMSRLMADIAHLKEKLTDLNQAFLQREDQLHELHTNNTYLLNRLEQESLRCGEQIKELKVQHEARVIKLPESAVPDQTAEPVGLIESSKERKLDFDETAKNNAMKDTIENFSMMVEDASKIHIKNVEEAVNPEESDAGMPELEENGIVNLEDHPAALKKPLPLAPEVILNLPSKHPKDSKLVTGSLMTLELKPDVGNPPDPLQIQPLEMHSKQNTESSRKALFSKKRNTSFLNLKQNDEERDAQEDPADYRKDSINDAL